MRSARRIRALLGAAFVVALAAPAAGASPGDHQSTASNEAAGPLQVIGHLPEPVAGSERARQGHIAQIDARARRMYYIYADPTLVDHVATFDLRQRIPQRIADGIIAPDIQVPDVSPDTAALDTKRGDLVLIGFHVKVGEQVVQTDTPTLLRYDVHRNKALSQWEFEQRLPGFVPSGITYSAKDDLLYLVGDFSGSSVVSQTNINGAAVVTTLLAMSPDTGKILWVKPLPQCQTVLNSPHIGSLVARSDTRPAIYLACITGGTFAGTVNPGQSGLLRVDIVKGAKSADAAAKFPVDFFPISGQYFNGSQQGIASYDHHRDRFFLQSLSQTTPGAWVFDGHLSAWVGFVSAPDFTDVFSGVNEGLGHLYIGLNTQSLHRAPTDGIIVANASLTPVPAGAFDPLVTSTLITADSGSRRMFVSPFHNETTLEPYLVVEDRTPADVDLADLDFDSLTAGVSERDAAYVNYSADVNGYGADVVVIGGTNGPTSPTGNQHNIVPNVVAGGSRGLMLAHLGSVGLRPAGASASAQGLAADLNTTQDYQNNHSLGTWPYKIASCLDSGSGAGKQDASSTGGDAHVRCDLAHATATGTSTADGATAGGVHVSNAHVDAVTNRVEAVGARTTISATSSGISVDIPGGGSLHIGRASSVAGTRAHGVAGTTEATYERTIHGIVLLDAHGKPTLGPTACATSVRASGGHRPVVHDSCAAIADRITHQTAARLRIAFPLPESVATPGGAYAALQQTDADFFSGRTVDDQGVVYPHDSTAVRPLPAVQLEVYNDSAERSRLLAQFAAVQADSIFTTTAGVDEQPPGTVGSNIPEPQGPTTGPDLTQPMPAGVVPSGPTSTSGTPTAAPPTLAVPHSGVAGWLFVHRSLRDALLLAGTLALAAGAAALAFRRHQLLLAMSPTSERPRP